MYRAPILVLTAAPEPQLDLFIKHRLQATICSMSVAQKLDHLAASSGRRGVVHVKVDTGMGRIGITPEDTLAFMRQLKTLNHITVAGIFTHFATSDNKDLSFAEKQLSKFRTVLAELHSAGLDVPIKHCANSGAILQLPRFVF